MWTPPQWAAGRLEADEGFWPALGKRTGEQVTLLLPGLVVSV